MRRILIDFARSRGTRNTEERRLTSTAHMVAVSQNTLKSQLSSIYRKTGAARQSQLVCLLMQLPAKLATTDAMFSELQSCRRARQPSCLPHQNANRNANCMNRGVVIVPTYLPNCDGS